MKRVFRMTDGKRLLFAVVALAIVILTSCGETDNRFSIRGQVTSGSSGLSGVTMKLTGAAANTVTTDTNGNYSFGGLGNGNYTITPSKTGFTFDPASSAQVISNADITAVNFTVTAVPTFSISGSTGLSGVKIMLSGASSSTVTSDASGNYTAGSLVNGNYTVTPNKTGFIFSPASSLQTINGMDITAINFAATAVTTFSIFGTVTSGGSGLPGVTITLGGEGSAVVTTDANGNYIFSGLINSNYIITPSKVGFTFSPTSSSQTMSGANIAGFNFIAASTPAQIVNCPSAGTTNVAILDLFLTPLTVTVSVNGIVKWTNSGVSTHTVTSGTNPNSDGIFNSGNLGAGASFCVQFSATGFYPYFSTTDSSMTGGVTVQ